MPVFKSRRLVSVPADVAYAVAADVASYQDFLPLLEQSAIVGDVRESDNGKQFRARMMVGYKKLGLREQFISEVRCDRIVRTVTASSSEPPFRHMKTIWTVKEDGPRADVAIEIDYSMRNPLLQVALGSVMEMAVNKVMAAFEARAKAVQAAASNSS
jgi:coenzyme Q-binding protein COQ10